MSEGGSTSDEEVNPQSHKRLLAAINRIGKVQHIQKPVRNEPVLHHDEFHLVKSSTEVVGKVPESSVSVQDIVKVLNKTSKHLEVGKEFRNVKRNIKVLQKPLEKPVVERIQRTIGYENTKKKLSRWDAVVERNRLSDHQVFPLDYEEVHADLKVQEKPPTPLFKSELMLELEAVEAKLKALKNQDTPTTQEANEKNMEQRLTREELIARRKELAYLRIRESQKSAKARLQNKIKSKKYHKFLKREKLKEKIKEFEMLQKTDAEAALEKLEKIERSRVLERANLRHKNTGTWAKNLQVRAKYDKDVRKDLAEQLALSRELTQKRKKGDEQESQSSGPSDNEKEYDEDYDPFNPWMKSKKKKEQQNEVDAFISGYRKYWLQRNKNESEMGKYKNNMNSQHERRSEENKSNAKITNHVNVKKIKVKNGSSGHDTKHIKKRNNILSKNKSTKNKVHRNKKIIIKSGWVVEDCSSNPIKLIISSDSECESNISSKDIDDIFDKAEEFVKERVDHKLRKLKKQLLSKRNKVNKQTLSKDTKDYMDLSFKNAARRPEIDEELLETPVNQLVEDFSNTIIPRQKNHVSIETNNNVDTIDPNKFANVKPKTLKTSMPDLVNSGELFEESDEENEHNKKQMTIVEAFEDDDVIADFEKERENERKKNSIDDVDLTLPGWGHWAGCGISNKKRQKRLILKFPKEEKRRDDNKGNVYINEHENKKFKEHLVSDLPFPFTCVKDYEASIRAPLGRTFVPETAFRVLTRPAVVTKMGHIINPMDEKMLIKPPKQRISFIDRRIKAMKAEDK